MSEKRLTIICRDLLTFCLIIIFGKSQNQLNLSTSTCRGWSLCLEDFLIVKAKLASKTLNVYINNENNNYSVLDLYNLFFTLFLILCAYLVAIMQYKLNLALVYNHLYSVISLHETVIILVIIQNARFSIPQFQVKRYFCKRSMSTFYGKDCHLLVTPLNVGTGQE